MHSRKETLLIIDDDRMLAELIKAVVEGNSYRALTAATAVEGLREATRHKPDLILLDLCLPQMSGLGLLRKLKNSPELAHIPVVVLTGIDDEEVRSECLALGASEFLHKSSPFRDLAALLRAHSIKSANTDDRAREECSGDKP